MPAWGQPPLQAPQPRGLGCTELPAEVWTDAEPVGSGTFLLSVSQEVTLQCLQ